MRHAFAPWPTARRSINTRTQSISKKSASLREEALNRLAPDETSSLRSHLEMWLDHPLSASARIRTLTHQIEPYMQAKGFRTVDALPKTIEACDAVTENMKNSSLTGSTISTHCGNIRSFFQEVLGVSGITTYAEKMALAKARQQEEQAAALLPTPTDPSLFLYPERSEKTKIGFDTLELDATNGKELQYLPSKNEARALLDFLVWLSDSDKEYRTKCKCVSALLLSRLSPPGRQSFNALFGEIGDDARTPLVRTGVLSRSFSNDLAPQFVDFFADAKKREGLYRWADQYSEYLALKGHKLAPPALRLG